MDARQMYEKWLRDFAQDPDLVRELTAIAGDDKEIEDRFYRGLEFGTAGMRGVIGVVGPTRMDYAKITARLSYFAEGLSRMFSQGEIPAPPGQESHKEE